MKKVINREISEKKESEEMKEIIVEDKLAAAVAAAAKSMAKAIKKAKQASGVASLNISSISNKRK